MKIKIDYVVEMTQEQQDALLAQHGKPWTDAGLPPLFALTRVLEHKGRDVLADPVAPPAKVELPPIPLTEVKPHEHKTPRSR